MGNKRILVVFPHLGMGGVERSLAFVSNIYSRIGNSVFALSLSKTTDKLVQLDDNIHIEYIHLPNNLFRRFFFMIKLRQMIMNLKPDVIVVFRTDITRIIIMATLGVKVDIISSERGNPERYTQKLMSKYEKYLLKCKKVVFQTEYAKNFFCDEIQKKSVVIPNPCINKKECNSNKICKKVVLSCGRLSKEKNFDGLIRAFYKISKRIPEYELHIYGDGPEKEILNNIIDNLGTKKIKILPTVDDVFSIEDNASLFVLNSSSEGMPNALIEAMSVGIPCISTECSGGIIEHLADCGRRVFLVPCNNENILADAILQLIHDEPKRKKLSEAAKEIRIILSEERIRNMWINLLESLA